MSYKPHTMLADTASRLGSLLKDLPHDHGFDYTTTADAILRRELFASLIAHDEQHWTLLFPQGRPSDQDPWVLSRAQGAQDGAEYTAAARGRPCGHIFKPGETTYACLTCAVDETCVLCPRCFNESDHQGHNVRTADSSGSAGSCDCGDQEAWVSPVHCIVHGPLDEREQAAANSAADNSQSDPLPENVTNAITDTISLALDYLCDVLVCSPEQQRQEKTLTSTRLNEQTSRLTAPWYGHRSDSTPDTPVRWAMVLWNDEKHTVQDVQEQVARAVKTTKSRGLTVAHEVDSRGRCTVYTTTDLDKLLAMVKILEQTALSVTVRSCRDIFREEMCITIVDWLHNIAGCRVGNDPSILQSTICTQMLTSWRRGSPLFDIGMNRMPMYDHEREERTIDERYMTQRQLLARAVRVTTAAVTAARPNVTNDPDSDGDADEDDTADPDATTETDMEVNTFTGNLTAATTQAVLTALRDVAAHANVNRDILHNTALDADIVMDDQNGEPGAELTQDLASAELPSADETLPDAPPSATAHSIALHTPSYWQELPALHDRQDDYAVADVGPAEILRLDCLIMCDLRLWKILRDNIRNLYMQTLLVDPVYKRLLALRFASLFTDLSRLFLVADRESDHSIMLLTVQLFTTPSITAVVIDQANLLTRIMAVIHTFLTTRKVGDPTDVQIGPTMALEPSAIADKRVVRVFDDLQYMLQSDHVKSRVRADHRYLPQFLDLLQIHQGISPTTRAVGEHVPFEVENAQNAYEIAHRINNNCRLFAEAFTSLPVDDQCIAAALRQTALIATASSLGRRQFTSTELATPIEFRKTTVEPELFEHECSIPDISVMHEALSFMHPLHQLLSWLLQGCRHMTAADVKNLLCFSQSELDRVTISKQGTGCPPVSESEALSALFDVPLRTITWASQIRASLWVRNGGGLRYQQLPHYRDYRNLPFNRDFILVQAGLVLCDNNERDAHLFLAQMLERFDMAGWIANKLEEPNDVDQKQQFDMVEDFHLLLTALICEREALLVPTDPKRTLQRELAHSLCFKPLTMSQLSNRLGDRITRHKDFDQALFDMTRYKAPEGTSDFGTFELKEEYIDLVDSSYIHYTRNQREEAERIRVAHVVKQTGQPMAEVVLEPKLPKLSGLFQGLTNFTHTRIFSQMIAASILFVTDHPHHQLLSSRLESLLNIVLHLLLIVINEDDSYNTSTSASTVRTVSDHMLSISEEPETASGPLVALEKLLRENRFPSCHARIRQIAKRLQEKRPAGHDWERWHFVSADLQSTPASEAEQKARKKQQALERQARIMAKFKQDQNAFMDKQGFDWASDDVDDSSMIPLGEDAVTSATTLVPYVQESCMLCQEATGEDRLHGSFAYISESKFFRGTPTDDVDFLLESLDVPQSLDRSEEVKRPFGLAANAMRYRHELSTDASRVTPVSKLPKNFPSSHIKTGPIASSCSHVMHFSCFRNYEAATERRHVNQIARSHPEDTHRKEFLCPLCKAIGNVFLPMICKGRTETDSDSIDCSAAAFSDWLCTVDADVSMVDAKDGHHARVKDRLHTSVLSEVAAKNSSIDAAPITEEERPATHWLHAAIRRKINDLSRYRGLPGRTTAAETPAPTASLLEELATCYERLHTSLDINVLHRPESQKRDRDQAELLENDTLALALSLAMSSTMAALEIAQRGQGGAKSFLGAIPSQSMSNLHLISDTLETSLFLQDDSQKESLTEISVMRRHLLGHFHIRPIVNSDVDSGGNPLSYDVFRSLTFVSAVCPDLWLRESQHVLRLAYTSYMVHAVSCLMPCLDRLSKVDFQGLEISAATKKVVTDFVLLLAEYGNESHAYGPGDFEGKAFERIAKWGLGFNEAITMQNLLRPYLLVFLRRCILLMHIRRGINFATAESKLEHAMPELERLSQLLGLPLPEQLMRHVLSHEPGARHLRAMVPAWLTMRVDEDDSSLPDHPAIYELVGLPNSYDTFGEEVMKRKCPTSGDRVMEPVICLLCGDIFCGQTTCCGQGGANKHMRGYVIRSAVRTLYTNAIKVWRRLWRLLDDQQTSNISSSWRTRPESAGFISWACAVSGQVRRDGNVEFAAWDANVSRSKAVR